MPIFTDPEVQKFIEQQTGVNPIESLRRTLPASISPPSVGQAVYPIGTPIGFQAGQSLYDAIGNKQFLKPVGNWLSNIGTNSGGSAAATALALGLGGAGFGLLTGRNPVSWGLAGAGAGALAGYGLSELSKSMTAKRHQRSLSNLAMRQMDAQRRQRNEETMPKVSYYGMQEENPMSYIQSRMFSDPSLGSSEKAMLMSSLQVLPRESATTLADILRTVGGASVGYIIAKFILNLGGMGQTIGAAAGGLLGASMGSHLPVNKLGERVDTQYDLFGRRRFVT
jgi:hypothetical protein